MRGSGLDGRFVVPLREFLIRKSFVIRRNGLLGMSFLLRKMKSFQTSLKIVCINLFVCLEMYIFAAE